MALGVAADREPEPPEPASAGVAARLEHGIAWYDRRAVVARRSYLTLKVAQLVLAAAIPVGAAAGAGSVFAAVLGGTIVVVEGLQQLFKFHDSWLGYRSACEALQRERYLFGARAGPYRDRPDPEPLLAERVESVMAREHDAWRQAHMEPEKDEEHR